MLLCACKAQERIVFFEILSPLLDGSKVTFLLLLPFFSSMVLITQPEIQRKDVPYATGLRNSTAAPLGFCALHYKRVLVSGGSE